MKNVIQQEAGSMPVSDQQKSEDATVVQSDGSEQLLSDSRMCKGLDVSRTTFWRMKKDLPYVAIGKRRRYRLSEVMQHLARKTDGNGGAQ